MDTCIDTSIDAYIDTGALRRQFQIASWRETGNATDITMAKPTRYKSSTNNITMVVLVLVSSMLVLVLVLAGAVVVVCLEYESGHTERRSRALGGRSLRS